MQTLGSEVSYPHWKGLYRIAGPATMTLMVFFLFDTVCWALLGPYPSSAEGWFALLKEDRSTGLLLLSLPTFFGMILYYLTFLGLYDILRRVNTAYATLATLLACVGVTILLVTSLAYPIIHLSDLYADAPTEQQRTLLLAAGETKIVTAAVGVTVGGFLAEGGLVVFSLLMLESRFFGKGTAYVGILGHGLDLARIVMSLAFLPERIGAVLLMIGGLPQLIWLVLVSRRFFRLGWSQGATTQSASG